jgi:hypothetical protein
MMWRARWGVTVGGMVAWDRVTRTDVLHAMQKYDRLGPEEFFAEHGFAPTTTYDLVWANAATRRKQSWARRTSWPPETGSAPVISKAASPARSGCSEGSDSPSRPDSRPFSPRSSLSLENVMRAIVIERFGGPDCLVYRDLPEPAPLAGQVVIEVKAFGLNHAEMHMRRGEWAEAAPVSGIECVGLVKAAPGGEFPVGRMWR